jgi:ABC-type transport system substrate-binding protein
LLRWLAIVSLVFPFAPSHAQSTLRIGIRDDLDLLDPTFSRTYVGTVVMTALCDKLFDFDANLNIVPMLSTGYEWTDSKTLLIHLRPNVAFHDGEKLDAAAVKYTLERPTLNMARYTNATVDDLLDRARAATGTAERRGLYAQVWQQESRDLPIIYLYTQRNIQGVANAVVGFTLLADGLLRLQDVRPAQ